MISEDLKSLGLTDNEARVYLALRELGNVRAAAVIKETGLHRNLVYLALERLAAWRLVSKTTKGAVLHFKTTDPEHFRDLIREQELAVGRVIDDLKDRGKLSEQDITVYEGDDAIRTFSLRSVSDLKPGEYIHVLGSGGKRFERAMGPQALKAYDGKIVKHGGIRILMYRRQEIAPERARAFRQLPHTEIHSLPFDVQPSANVIFTDHFVAFQILDEPYSVVEIRNAHLVNAYKSYFQLLCNQTVRVEQGMEAFHDAFYDMVDALRPGEEYHVLGGNLGREYARMDGFFDAFHRYRIERGVGAKILAQYDVAGRIRDRVHRQGDPEERVSKVKSFETPFLSPVQINLYQGKAVMVIYKPEPTVLYFDDPQISEGFKLYFDEIWNRQTETLRGHEGIIKLCERVLEEGKDLYHIAATGAILKTHPDYYADFTRRRVEKGLHLRMLANEETRGGKLHTLPLSEVKYLPKSFASPMVIWIFGDTVAHVLWREPETVFLIHDAQTADYYRTYYKALEAVAKP